MRRPRFRRPEVKRAVVLLPNGFTLFNLFCGIYAIVLSSRGSFGTAAFFVVLGGIADALDGRVARFTGTGSEFGEELDSLVDAISFGLAPAMIMYFAVLNRQGWDWLFVFFFVACAVMRLARFNVEQAGKKKTHFHGLPSPAAGMTLATYYWFSQTPLYNEAIIFFTSSTTLADLPWHVILRWLMFGLACLMVSDVPYPAVPTIGFRSLRQLVGTAIVVGGLAGLILLPREFMFPALVGYVVFGVVQGVVMGLLGFVPGRRSIFLEEEEDVDPAARPTYQVPSGADDGTRGSAHADDGATTSDDSSAVPGRDTEGGGSRRRRRRRRPRAERPESQRPESQRPESQRPESQRPASPRSESRRPDSQSTNPALEDPQS